ncbi:hypothetical protein ACM13U_001945, partial [Campylobacter jejuni]
KRKKEFALPQKEVSSRWLRMYQKLVSNASKGAVLDME